MDKDKIIADPVPGPVDPGDLLIAAFVAAIWNWLRR